MGCCDRGGLQLGRETGWPNVAPGTYLSSETEWDPSQKNPENIQYRTLYVCLLNRQCADSIVFLDNPQPTWTHTSIQLCVTLWPGSDLFVEFEISADWRGSLNIVCAQMFGD